MLNIFLDIETTGLDPRRHAPIDIGIKIYDPVTRNLKGEYQTLIKQSEDVWRCGDPESLKVNGYTYEDISKGSPPEIVGKQIEELFSRSGIRRGQAVFICQNPSFDRPFFAHMVDVYVQERLQWPYHWLDLASMYWAKMYIKSLEEGGEIPKIVNLSKNSIAALFGLAPEASPHRAMNGVNHLIKCYEAVLGIQFLDG